MKRFPILAVAVLAISLGAWHGGARAQSVTPRQIQGLINNGQADTALADLQAVLQAHPDSGVAWYLSAEAQDATGNEDAARDALAKAEQFAPGLPFAKPNDVAALQAHLDGGGAPHRRGIGLVPLVIGGLVLLFVLMRFFARRRVMPMAYGAYPGQAGYGQPGYGPGGMPYGPAGGGIGSGLLSGLAAGAGFAAGERIIDDLSGNRGYDQGQGFDQSQSFDPDQVPDRDDGLNGSPGWDDNSNNNDPGNNW
jgi:hypothetical protein